jgi:hypothetical protein
VEVEVEKGRACPSLPHSPKQTKNWEMKIKWTFWLVERDLEN